jgi:D-alanyl-D-alanine carboxypeptidase/D-alanyl-D-alanine-endopeptidase (penicillin-binding protein 4)
MVFTACQSSESMIEHKPSTEQTVSSLAVMLDTSDVFNSQLTGFALYDPAGDSLIYGQNENRYFTPASNVKLLTFYAGLKILPDSLRALEYVVRGDTLIFWGTGDPSFLHHELGNEKVYNFLKNTHKQLVFSDSNFDDKLLGPGWSWEDYNFAYQTEKTPLPMYGNTIRFKVRELFRREIVNTEQGLAITPALFRKNINDTTVSDQSFALFRERDGNNIDYQPEMDTTIYTLEKPYHYTPQLVTQMLTDTLQKSVSYDGNIAKPAQTNVIYSISADSAYKQMLWESDNFIAEQLLLVMAAERRMPLNSKSVIQEVQSKYFNDFARKPQWVDGSGLSRYNMITPRSMIMLLSKIDTEFEADHKLFKLFPAGGKRGTIENWYTPRSLDSAYVFAKTGTLSNNHSLSGYLKTSSGKKLIFSFMNNHYVGSSSLIKKEMEKVLWYIHQAF